MPPKPPTQEASPVRYDVSLLTAEDFYLFNEGSHYRIYEKMGAHLVEAKGTMYKFHIDSTHHTHETEKADPVGLFTEKPPRTASVVWDLNYTWNDAAFLEKRAAANSLHAPMSIYEVHLGSWMRVPEEDNRSL